LVEYRISNNFCRVELVVEKVEAWGNRALTAPDTFAVTGKASPRCTPRMPSPPAP